jgi:hypothetical protein
MGYLTKLANEISAGKRVSVHPTGSEAVNSDSPAQKPGMCTLVVPLIFLFRDLSETSYCGEHLPGSTTGCPTQVGSLSMFETSKICSMRCG